MVRRHRFSNRCFAKHGVVPIDKTQKFSKPLGWYRMAVGIVYYPLSRLFPPLKQPKHPLPNNSQHNISSYLRSFAIMPRLYYNVGFQQLQSLDLANRPRSHATVLERLVRRIEQEVSNRTGRKAALASRN